MNKNYLFIIGGIIAVIFILNPLKKEAIGSANWPSDCSFITNVNPYSSSYTSYDNSGAWISIDSNADITKEKFGKYSSNVPLSYRACQCGGSCGAGKSSILSVSDFNSNGDDIYSYNDGTEIYITVCSSSGYAYIRMRQDYGAASNAVTTCGTCTPSCSGKTCGDDGCGGSCGTCSTGYTCTNNQCIQSSTCPSTICNDNVVSYDEAISVLNKWVGG